MFLATQRFLMVSERRRGAHKGVRGEEHKVVEEVFVNKRCFREHSK